MLKTRILTAVVLAPLFFAWIFMASADQFGIALIALLSIGSWEFRKLAGLDSGVGGWVMLVAQLILFALLYRYREALPHHAVALLTAACLIWLMMFLRLILYRPQQPVDFQFRLISAACALAALSFGWIALYTLRVQEQGQFWILVLLLIIWSADTGAYFSGRAFGKRKLAPAISPGKTVAGLVGGLITAALVSLATVHFIPAISAAIPGLIVLTAVTALVSAGGDLFISLHKRRTGHKDSGAIFPGHGGVLDRFDSLLSGAPFFALGFMMLGY